MKNKKLITLLIWAAVFAIVINVVVVASNKTEPEELAFSAFTVKMEAGDVKAVKLVLSEDVVYGLYSQSTYEMKDLPKKADFYMIISEEAFTRDMAALIAEEKGVSIDSVTSNDYPFEFSQQLPEGESLLVVLLPYLLIGAMAVLLVVFVVRQQNGGKQAMNFSKSRAHLHGKGDPVVTFADVAGADEEKAELAEMVDFLRDPKRFINLGARIPKGVLLVGPPGTGKTLLAKAVAGEAKVPFFSISGSDFVEMFVGVGASRVRDLFETAKKSAPAIVFIDEIDAVGRQRGAGLGGGHDEREQTLNQLLVEMDGFATNESIIVMAATNRADILDPALLRPGRFDRQVTMNYPDVKGREEILKVHARNKKFTADVDFKALAKRTSYFTGADLENVLNEAAILTARANLTEIGNQQLSEAVMRVQLGPEKKSRVVTERDKCNTAYHECGHAILALELPLCDNLEEISIISRGPAAGYTLTLPEDDYIYMTEQRMLDRICMSLGGRVAEKFKFGDVTTGAIGDLKSATALARRMVEEFGMSDVVGPVFLGGDTEVFIAKDWGHGRNYSEKIAAQIDIEIRRIMEEQFARAEGIITAHAAALDECAQLLLTLERVNGDEFETVYRKASGLEPKSAKVESGAKPEAPDESIKPAEA